MNSLARSLADLHLDIASPSTKNSAYADIPVDIPTSPNQELPAWDPATMFASTVLPVALNIPCAGIAYQIDAAYKSGCPPWPLNAHKHDSLPPPHSFKQAFFCACMWERIPSPPNTNIWTAEARRYLSILWFLGDFHEGNGPYFTAAHYHECLALLLGHRVEQIQVFTMINQMRKNLPEEWTDAAKYDKESQEVVAVFDELSQKWENFFRKFTMYSSLNGADLDADFEGKAFWAEKQPYKFTMVLADIEMDMKRRGEYTAVNTQKLEWHTEIGDEDFSNGEEGNEDTRRLRDLEKAVKKLKFARKGLPIEDN